MSPLYNRIEPDTHPVNMGRSATYEVMQTHALLSIAVSLKRIADAFDGTTLGVDITDSLAGGFRDRL